MSPAYLRLLPGIPRILYSRYFVPEIFPNHHTIPFTNPRALQARGVVTGAVAAHEWITAQSQFAREFAILFDLQAPPLARVY